MKRIKNLWKTGIINLLFQILFLFILYLVGNENQINLSGFYKILFNIGIVFIPCLVWTIFFYRQDRIEPEPTHYVIIAFIVGMAIASLFQLPLEKDIFNLNKWIYSDISSLILGSILLFGIITSFLFYISLRYGFYVSKEFDEPVDGMVYGAFIGSGFAAVKSLTYLNEIKDLTIFAAGYTTSTNILVYASIASLIGFFIGKAKFNQTRKNINFIIGLLLGIFLLGLYNIFSNLIYLQGSQYGFFYSFILTLVLSIVMLLTVFIEMRKLTKVDLHKEVKVDAKPDLSILILLLLFLIPGILVQNYYLKESDFIKDKFSFKYDRNLVTASETRKISLFDQNLFTKENNSSKGLFKSLYSVTLKNYSTDIHQIDISQFVDVSAIQYPVNKEYIEINGIKCIKLKYSTFKTYENQYWYPILILNVITIIPFDSKTLVISFSSSIENFDIDLKYYDDILKSFQLKK
jgi:RsiW-degrading membrane proteinase PrsW (M82 family)